MQRILRAAAAMGASSVLSVGLGAVRYKVIALELGATGVGLLGVLATAMVFGVTLFGLGLNSSGVRATAAVASEGSGLRETRTALLTGSAVLGLVGGVAVVLGSSASGLSLLPRNAGPVLGLSLGLAVAAMVYSGGQLAVLNGLGDVRSLAKANAIGAICGTIVTVAAVYVSGQAGLVAALAAAPVATVFSAGWYLRHHPVDGPRASIASWAPELAGMLKLGIAVTLSLLLTSGTQLLVRVFLQHHQGLEAAGYFQAAWTVAALYLGFVLTGLAAEYYPRISAHADDAPRINASVDAQIRLALALSTPAIVWTMVLAPVGMHLLYAPEFQVAVPLLRWQLLGDVFKVAGWAIGFLLLAREAKLSFFLAELAWNGCYALLTVVVIQRGGFAGLGVAYAVSNVVYLTVTLLLARRQTGFRLRTPTLLGVAGAVAVSAATLVALGWSGGSSYAAAAAIATVATVGSVGLLWRWRGRPSPVRLEGEEAVS